MKLRKDYSDLTEIRLEQNYRSTQTILSAATSVITNNKSHPILKLFTDLGEGEKIRVIEGYSAQDEAAKVENEIQNLNLDGYAWEEIAILYRTNAQSRAFEEMFVRSGIPYILVGGTKFYERKEVKDVLAYIRVMLNPDDKVSYRRAEKNGKRRLASIMLDRDEYMENDPSAGSGQGHSAEQILEHVLEKTKYLDKFDEEVEEELARIENVRELQAVASEFSTLPEFLENVALVQAEYYADEKVKRSKQAVTLMTLHAAKGLEFRAVFMVGLEEGLFPHSRALEDKSEMEEERRLMYVGITRAKEKLFLSYATNRMIWGKSGLQMKSRFIEEIDSQLITATFSSAPVSQYSSRNARKWKVPEMKTKKTGIRIDALGDETLESFLSGDLSVDELLSR
jgi:DNA helicase-2/ATP-dependent DNA helicase PcrA